jgi:hypothetical protein
MTKSVRIKYDKLCLCTGGSYGFPLREALDENISLNERK